MPFAGQCTKALKHMAKRWSNITLKAEFISMQKPYFSISALRFTLSGLFEILLLLKACFKFAQYKLKFTFTFYIILLKGLVKRKCKTFFGRFHHLVVVNKLNVCCISCCMRQQFPQGDANNSSLVYAHMHNIWVYILRIYRISG